MTRRIKLSGDGVKHLAMLAMLCNHIAHGFLQSWTLPYAVLENIGYFTAPAMCWFLVRGVHRTRSRRNYLVRMFLFACLSQPIYSLYFGPPYVLDMLFTLSVCLGILYVRRSGLDRGMKLFLQVLLVLSTIMCDWPFLAGIMTIVFDASYRPDGRSRDGIAFLAVAGLMFLFQGFGVEGAWTPAENLVRGLAGAAGPLAAGTVLLHAYDPEAVPAVRAPRYYFYAFYPGHLLVLLLIRQLVQA